MTQGRPFVVVVHVLVHSPMVVCFLSPSRFGSCIAGSLWPFRVRGFFFDSFVAEAPFGASGQVSNVPLVVRRDCWHNLRAISSRHTAPPGVHANRFQQQRNACRQRESPGIQLSSTVPLSNVPATT